MHRDNLGTGWRSAAGAALILALGIDPSWAQSLSPETIAARQHYFGIDNVDPATGAVRSDRALLSWTGVSNFVAAFNGQVVFMNAWIARGWKDPALWPGMNYVGTTREELALLKPDLVLFGHGHGDHAGDTPFVIRQNPGVRVAGAAEHCADLEAEVTDVKFECISVFEADAALGTSVELPDLIPGVEVTAIKQPHSNTNDVTETNKPLDWKVGSTDGSCPAFAENPTDHDPQTWSAPNSGAITAMWQFRVGNFALLWQDTAGPIAGTGVPEALAALPQTDVRIASIVVAARSAINQQIEIIKPKLFVPVHHDPCGWTSHKGLLNELAKLPEDIRPELWYMSDPSDYLKPISFDPSAAVWRN
jgi:hypothetical protein